MSATTVATTRVANEQTGERPGPSVERARIPLVWKLFGMMAVLIALVVAVSIFVTIQRANRIARETVNSSIAGATGLYKELETQRLGRLALAAQLIGNDANFVSYIQEALSGSVTEQVPATGEAPAGVATPEQPAPATAPPAAAPAADLASIADQLEQRREALGTHLMILLDDQGRVVYRTDQPALTEVSGEDLYESTALVKKIVDENALESTTGVVRLGDRLFHAAVAPLGLGQPRTVIGYLLNAYSIDDAFANRIAESTKAGVMFAAPVQNSQPRAVARSSNAPGSDMSHVPSLAEIFRTRRMLPPSTVEIDKSAFLLTGEPLGAAGDVAGAAIFVRSLDRELAPFHEIERTLLIAGTVALLLAFLISWVVARRLTRPIESLAGIAQSVTAGDYNVHPETTARDEVGILGRAFAQMISSLRDKAELEQLYAAMSAQAEEREIEVAAPPPSRDGGAILVTEVRGVAENANGDERMLVDRLTRVMRLQEAEVRRQDGDLCEVSVHRLVAVFRGERGVMHAVRAARAINEELASQTDLGRVNVGIGIAAGSFVKGAIEVAGAPGRALVGSAPLLAMIFASNAPGGYAFVAPDATQGLGPELAANLTRSEVKLSWIAQPIPVASLPLVGVSTGIMGTQTTAGETMKLGGQTNPVVTTVDLAPGAFFANRYRIEQILGRGGMGVVYRANDTQLDETVAIKTLPGNVMQRSAEDLERFKREIRLARKITHRNVLRTYDYGESDGVYFISMEYVRGYTLAEMLDQSPDHVMVPRVAVGIGRQICRGLHAAHEQGIIHRDIKPQNVLLDARGEAKLMDFGVARLAEAKDAMTQAGLIVGTPHYMSPEQVRGAQLDPRSDVYAMGVLLYEMLAGTRPFESSSLTGILTAHLTEKPRPPIELRPEIGAQLNTIVMRCLAKEAKERYEDAGALLAALEGVRMAVAA